MENLRVDSRTHEDHLALAAILLLCNEQAPTLIPPPYLVAKLNTFQGDEHE
jgi:hypothetical protein